jgi:hypothetical protein
MAFSVEEGSGVGETRSHCLTDGRIDSVANGGPEPVHKTASGLLGGLSLDAH